MAPSIALRDFDAVLFDLDGVLTTTRAVHAAAWKRAFDEFLADWDARQRHEHRALRRPCRLRHLCRRQASRRTACATSWTSRGIELPEGSPDYAADEEIGVGARQPQAAAGRGGAGAHRRRGLPGLGRLGAGAARGRPQDRRRVQQPQLRRRAGHRRHHQPVRHPRRRRDGAGARPAGQAGARHVPGGGPATRRAPAAGDRGRGRAGRRRRRPGRRVRAGHRRRPGRARRRAGRARRRRGGRRPGRAAGGADRAPAPGRPAGAPAARRGPADHRGDRRLPRRPVAARRSAPTTPTTSSRPRRCSRCRTAFSASGPRSRRASRRTARRRCSTASTRPGRSCTRRARTASPPTGQTILPVPDGTTIRLLVDEDPVTCATTEVRELLPRAGHADGPPSTVRSCTSWPTGAGSGSRPSGSCRWRSGTWRASATR